MTLVEYVKNGRVSIITIRREDKRNAINAEVTAGLDEALNAFEDDDEQWVSILTGGTKVFSAGTDLGTGPGDPTPRGGEYGVIRRKRSKPLIAAVEGIAFGGGFELTMASDLVVAGRDAQFALPEVKRGVIANSGALFRATRVLPRNLALELLLTGEPISAERAQELGFVNRLADPGEALAVAVSLAETIAANAPVSVSQTLQAVDSLTADADGRGWEATMRGQDIVVGSEDFAEGIGAFFEKRDPEWKNR